MLAYVRNLGAPLALAFLLALPATARAGSAVAARRDTLEVATFEAILEIVEGGFFDPDLLGVDWEAVGARYRARVDSVESPADLRRLMTRMLREMPASHMDLLDAPAGRTDDADHGEEAAVPRMEWSPIPGHPGLWWVRVRSFDALDAARVDALMTDLAGSRGAILDVRGNEGGDVSFLDLAGRFFRGPVTVFGLVSRQWLEATAHPLDRPVALEELPQMGAPYTIDRLLEILESRGAMAFRAGRDDSYGGCVAVLIDGDTGSSAEAFTLAMNRRAEAPLVGETTAGALLSSQEFPLPNGWRLRIPVAVGVDGDGRIFWDVPIDPDVPTEPSDAMDAAVAVVEGCMESPDRGSSGDRSHEGLERNT